MKPIKEMHVWLILIALLVTVGALFGGQALANQLQVDRPWQREIRAIKAIKDFDVKQQPDGVIIELKMQKVANLQNVLDQVERKAAFYFNKPVKGFEISGRSNAHLEEARYRLSFYLEEALASGHYVQLEGALNSLQGIKAKVYLSQDYIYLQFEEGPYYLYQALPRPQAPVSDGAGGEAIQ